jgi:hypothetical protein
VKIGLAVDNTLGLHLPSLKDFIVRHASAVTCEVLTSRFNLPVDEIEYDEAVKLLSPEIRQEMKKYELSFLLTAIPFSNNFFYTGMGRTYIVSLSGWNSLTSLPMSNGIAYMLCEVLIGRMDIGSQHSENTGCVNDFLWDKRGIDVGMRAAFVCDRCRLQSRGNRYLDGPEFKDVVAILNALSSASREGTDILLEPVITPAEAAKLKVFLCHNNTDKPLVRQLNQTLKNAKISTWFDEQDLNPGDVWQDVLEKAIATIGSCLVIVGDSGLGPWQDIERRAFINEFANRGCKIMPVLVGHPAKPPELPLFLKQFMWADLRNNDNLQIGRLIGALRPE